MSQFDRPIDQSIDDHRFEEVVQPAIFEDIKQEILSGDYAGSEADLDLAFKDGLINMDEYGKLVALLMEHMPKEN